MFGQLLEPYVNAIRPCRVEGVKAKGQKEVRIIGALEPVMRQHRPVLDQNVIRADPKQPVANSALLQLTHMQYARGALKTDYMDEGKAMGVRKRSEKHRR